MRQKRSLPIWNLTETEGKMLTKFQIYAGDFRNHFDNTFVDLKSESTAWDIWKNLLTHPLRYAASFREISHTGHQYSIILCTSW